MSHSTELATEALTNDSHRGHQPDLPTGSRPRAVKWFVAIVTSVMAFDVYPPEYFAWPDLKQKFNQSLSFVGLEQSQWRLFAPDPGLHAWWFEAEIDNGNEPPSRWVSPQWPKETNWSKFYRFRELNYYDRLGQTPNEAALEDFTQWIQQQQVAPEKVRSITVYKVEKVMLSDSAGFPTPDETLWTFSRLRVAHREYGSP